jgi:hypothetical protein
VCTLSAVVTEDGGVRILHSRDELRSRSPELAPEWRTLESGHRAWWPTDADAGGTWVGVREDGVYLGLLNLNLEEGEFDDGCPEMFTISRGSLIPTLMELEDIAAMVSYLTQANFVGMSPFRLVLIGRDGAGFWDSATARFAGAQVSMTTELGAFEGAVCLASSGLGDRFVQCRLPLFEEIVGDDRSAESQWAFHRHQWADRPAYSVLMSRTNARTSSITAVEIDTAGGLELGYETVPEGCPESDPVGSGMLQ